MVPENLEKAPTWLIDMGKEAELVPVVSLNTMMDLVNSYSAVRPSGEDVIYLIELGDEFGVRGLDGVDSSGYLQSLSKLDFFNKAMARLPKESKVSSRLIVLAKSANPKHIPLGIADPLCMFVYDLEGEFGWVFPPDDRDSIENYRIFTSMFERED